MKERADAQLEDLHDEPEAADPAAVEQPEGAGSGGGAVDVDRRGVEAPHDDPRGEEALRAHLFVGALGASGYAYAEATRTESLPDWLGVRVRAFGYYPPPEQRTLQPWSREALHSRLCRASLEVLRIVRTAQVGLSDLFLLFIYAEVIGAALMMSYKDKPSLEKLTLRPDPDDRRD
jgi:hypothetical protein